MNGVVVLAPRTGENAHFLFSSSTEERVLFLEREEKGVHGGLHCFYSTQKRIGQILSRPLGNHEVSLVYGSFVGEQEKAGL